MDAIGAGRQRRVGQHRTTALGRHDLGNFAIAASDDDRRHIGGDGAAPDMDDHRRAGDQGERFARQSGCGESRRNDDDRGAGQRRRHNNSTNRSNSDNMPGSGGRRKDDISRWFSGGIRFLPTRHGGKGR